MRDQHPVKPLLVEVETSFHCFRTCVLFREKCTTPTIQVSRCRKVQTMDALYLLRHFFVIKFSPLPPYSDAKTHCNDFLAIAESLCPFQGRTRLLAFFLRSTSAESPFGAPPEIKFRLGVSKPEKSRLVLPVSLCQFVRAAGQHVERPLAWLVTAVGRFGS